MHLLYMKVKLQKLHSKFNWQKIISFVPQNSYLIDGSILENITYGTKSSDIDNSRVEECAKTSEIFEFLKKTDSGLKLNKSNEFCNVFWG